MFFPEPTKQPVMETTAPAKVETKMPLPVGQALAAMTRSGAGYSHRPNVRDAVRDACASALQPLDGTPPDIVLLFSTTGYDPRAVVDEVRTHIGTSVLVGCSGEGVIARGVADEGKRALCVMAIASRTLRFQSIASTEYGIEPVRSAETLATQILAQGATDIRGVILFADGLQGNCNAFLRTLEARLPPGTILCGGTAGDAMAFERTHQYHGDKAHGDTVSSGAVTGLVIRGAAKVRVETSHGCLPIGTERQITKADAGWLREIDGRRAWDVFREYLDGDPQDLNAEGIVHLCIGEPLSAGATSDHDEFVIHTPLKLDKDTGALFFPGGGIAEGTRVRLTRRDPSQIVSSSRACVKRLLAHSRRPPAFVLQFDCAGRGRILFGSATRDVVVAPMQTEAPETTWAGFFTYGEIAPVGGRPFYHNYTAVLCGVFDEE